jgi:threonine/homoserine/homoserine lactone efflux protein
MDTITSSSFDLIVAGVVFGLSAGVSPGPLLTLVISETLSHGLRAGIRVAVAPLVTDGPIILISIFLLSQLSQADAILGIVSIIGALFIAYLGFDSLRIREVDLKVEQPQSKSLQKGILTNALSPHPYVFWFSVGGPYMVKGLEVNLFMPLLFIVAFLFFLVGSKVVVAFITERSRAFLKSTYYLYLVRFLGVLLLVFSVMLMEDGLQLLGIL